MHQALIADDEARDRNIIKILLEKRYSGQFCILEAENGSRALEILQSRPVDLVLLDINMPGLSGIDVLHELRNTPYVVILTAYSNFEYTREALRCGVRDYLLKPPLREEFYGAVDRFLQDSERVQESLDGQLQCREVFTRDLAQQLMYYGDRKKIQGLLSVLDITGDWAMCGILNVQTETGRDIGYELDEAEEFLDRSKASYAAAACSGGIAVFLFCKRETADMELLRQFTDLSSHLEGSFCVTVQLQVGALAPLGGGYPKTFLELLRFDGPQGENPFGLVRQAELERAVRRREFDTTMEVLKPLLDALKDQGHDDLLKYQIIAALTQCTKQVLSSTDAKDAYHEISSLINARSREKVTETTARYVQRLLQAFETTDRPHHKIIQEILKEVQQDCSQLWSIEVLADRFYLNANYLSHLFKKYTGQCFTEYLAEQRICRAVELMHISDLSLAQIGEQVGYADPNYFSRVFKKCRGVGPREFSKTLEIAQKEKSSTNV